MSDFQNMDQQNDQINEEPVKTEDTGCQNEGKVPEDQGSDGTYRYSSRDSQERPSYMKDDVSGPTPRPVDPENFFRLKAKNSETEGSDQGSRSEEPGRESQNRTSYEQPRDSRAEDNRGPSQERRYDYDYDYNEKESNSRKGGFFHKGSRDSGRRGSANKTNKALMIVGAALLLGAAIGSGCWFIGSRLGGNDTAVAQNPAVGTEGSGGSSLISPEQRAAVEESLAAAKENQDNGQTGGQLEQVPTIDNSGAANQTTGQIVINDVSDVVEMAMPSVVAITTKTVYESYNTYGYNPFYGFYGYNGNGGSNQYEAEGAGSGIIIGDDGEEIWIVTNNHVVEGSESLTVSFSDDTTVNGYIKGTDSEHDLAVVGVKMSDLSVSTKSVIRAIQMGDSDTLRLGEPAIAIGNALGIGQSVTTGCISAVNREITTENNTKLTTIQTDAAINPGNSGGALLNSKGELIGINVAKDSEVSVEGMGYAIPISSAKEIISKLTTMKPREAVEDDQFPYMGLQLKDMDASVAQNYGIPEGVLVYGVEENSPAADAGILVQDILTGFADQSVSTYNELIEEMQYHKGGSTVTITVQRLENGSYVEKKLEMKLGLRSDYETNTDQNQSQEAAPQESAPQNGNSQNGNSQNGFNPFFQFGN